LYESSTFITSRERIADVIDVAPHHGGTFGDAR
jgi:hypothetical protein